MGVAVTSSTVVSSAELEEDGDKARELRTKADIEIEILVRRRFRRYQHICIFLVARIFGPV